MAKKPINTVDKKRGRSVNGIGKVLLKYTNY